MTTPQPQVLSVAERNLILRQYVESEKRDNASMVGQVYSDGRITLSKKGPHVTAWGDTWADVAYGWVPTDPRVILVNVILMSLCCGLWLPFWLFSTLKKPPVYRLSIDEYGYQHSVQHEVSRGQKTLRWVILTPMVLIGVFFGYALLFGGSDDGAQFTGGRSQSGGSDGASTAVGPDVDQIKQLVKAWDNDLNNHDLAGLQSLMCSGSASELPRDIFSTHDNAGGTLSSDVSNIRVNGEHATASVTNNWAGGSASRFDNSYAKENGVWKICHTLSY